VHVKRVLSSLCLLLLLSMTYTAQANQKGQVPSPEMEPNSIRLTPMTPHVGPGGEGEITVTFQ
jgi:hypothetical protein